MRSQSSGIRGSTRGRGGCLGRVCWGSWRGRGGKFWMGSDKGRDPSARPEELPQHEVELESYWVGKYPVTVAQYRAFVEDSGHTPQDRDCLGGVANHPVVWVGWDEAVKY